MQSATEEQLAKAFDETIENMQSFLLKAVSQGDGHMVSPTAMLIMRTTPNFENTALQFKALQPSSIDNPVRVGIFSPVTLTPPGMARMPKDVFWLVMKFLAHKSDAYAIIVGMEAWVAKASASDVDKLPASLADYEGREEALLVTAERKGERRLYQAMMRRDGDKLTFDPWVQDTTVQLQGNVFRDNGISN